MTVKELIVHLQTFDENAVFIVPVLNESGDPCDIVRMDTRDVEARGKYVILFDNMPFSEDDIEGILSK